MGLRNNKEENESWKEGDFPTDAMPELGTVLNWVAAFRENSQLGFQRRIIRKSRKQLFMETRIVKKAYAPGVRTGKGNKSVGVGGILYARP